MIRKGAEDHETNDDVADGEMAIVALLAHQNFGVRVVEC